MLNFLLETLFIALVIIDTRTDCYTAKIKGSEHAKVVIIGAGASGYAAGCHLLEHGFNDFVILEAHDRIGGRVHTVHFDNGSIEMGAEWIHGGAREENLVYELARDLNLVYSELDETFRGRIYRSDGKTYSLETFDELLDMFNSILDVDAMKGRNESLGDYFQERYWPRINPWIEEGRITQEEAKTFLKLLEHLENSNDASHNWYQTAISTVTLIGPVTHHSVWKSGGYKMLFDVLAKKLPNPAKQLQIDDKIRLNKAVTRVDWSSGGVTVSCADGTQVTADRVLVTVSLNVLKATADDMFHPALPPSNLKAIKYLGMGTVNKIFMEFSYRWWEAQEHMLLTTWRDDELVNLTADTSWVKGVFMFSMVAGHPYNLLCVWINGREAEDMESVSDEVVKNELMKLLRRLIGPSKLVPDAISIRKSSWSSDPFVRGSWSYRMLSSDTESVWANDLAEPVVNASGAQVILFAGEATNDNQFGTVHGAIETGLREANRILGTLLSN